MSCLLTKLNEKNNTWKDIVKSFGVNKDTAADVVQEMYIIVHQQLAKKKNILYENGEINYFYIFIILRNLVYDLKRKEKKITFTELNEISDQSIIDYIEKDYYGMHKAITDWYENIEYLEMSKDDTKLTTYDKDKLRIYYLRKIFKEVFIDKKKVAKLSRESKITYWSLRNTIKIIVKQIKNNYEIRRHNRKNN